MSNPKPLWRWWLFCAALSLWGRLQWRWLSGIYAWCVLPGWLGAEDELTEPHTGETPF